MTLQLESFVLIWFYLCEGCYHPQVYKCQDSWRMGGQCSLGHLVVPLSIYN